LKLKVFAPEQKMMEILAITNIGWREGGMEWGGGGGGFFWNTLNTRFLATGTN